MKLCKTCGEVKPESEFNRYSRSKDGLYHQCRECHKAYQREWRMKNRAASRKYSRTYYWQDPEKHRAYGRAYYQTHKEECCARSKRWHEANREILSAYNHGYRKAHKVERAMEKLRAMRGEAV